MSRRERRDRSSGKNISIISFWGIVLILIVAFVLSYVLYSGKISRKAKSLTNNTQRISSVNESDMINMITNSENLQEASSTIGKSVNELENNIQNTQTSNEITKMAVNTSEIENKKKSTTEETKVENTSNTEISEEKQENVEEENIADPTFVKPVEGEIIKDYSKDNLIYSNTLDEWTTHLGIDFASEKTDIVKAAADGKIKSIKNDPRYGLTVVIEHTNGFESIYSSLLTAEFVKVGEEVKQGQTIATVGNTARFEIADETHLHFEIKKNGENVDPNIYIR